MISNVLYVKNFNAPPIFKQTDGCAMGEPSSVTFSDIFMIKMENDTIIPTKPIFYHRYADDIYNRRNKNIEDSLFKALNSYHKNRKLTIEINPIAISWNKRKLSSLFRLEDKNLYPACKIYYGKCQCGEDYIGEGIRNSATLW